MSRWIARAVLALALCAPVSACIAPGGPQVATAPPGSEYWERLKADPSYKRYDYPGPALTGGCVC